MGDCFDDGAGNLVFVAVTFVIIGILLVRNKRHAA